jgi:hypothetical protein
VEVVGERTWHSDRSLLYRVVVMSVASTMTDLVPSVRLKYLDYRSHFHEDTTVGKSLAFLIL